MSILSAVVTGDANGVAWPQSFVKGRLDPCNSYCWWHANHCCLSLHGHTSGYWFDRFAVLVYHHRLLGWSHWRHHWLLHGLLHHRLLHGLLHHWLHWLLHHGLHRLAVCIHHYRSLIHHRLTLRVQHLPLWRHHRLHWRLLHRLAVSIDHWGSCLHLWIWVVWISH